MVFHNYFQKVNDQIKSIQLAPQYRTKLKNPFLKQFKVSLEDCELVKNKKGKAYEQHLWALALHATKSTYPRQIKKLRDKMLMQEKGIEIKPKKRHISEN
ncbi:Uncharacterised protein [Legionella bozemanae]|uniref:Uncharacterized protein n=2 Tax=Legionella bozemanae TaxID=447 RepID=A0A0W0RQ17_LEGBO|nr:hypothetical protein [Legionella bozemanae]KTC73147.1 hypothetical protein Lboz_1793 [Legionella bozemanae]STP14090.1 Uncharacterised protein [Legionella bozemanae]